MVDDVLLTIMRKPRSYTGGRGRDSLSRRCFSLAQNFGTSAITRRAPSRTGKFNQASFLNGKMDLSQAEAVLDLIRARTDKAAALALTQARGELSKWVHGLREELLDILVQVEAAIDFPRKKLSCSSARMLFKKLAIYEAKY